jgi:uncharacterized protein YuzE
MKITYDRKANTAYMKLNDKATYQSSRKVTEDVLIDYAKDGAVVGIEVLAASKNMPLPVSQTRIPIQSN